jgi:Na+/proline symporter
LGDARRALIINAAVAAIVAVLFFAVGSTLYAFYHQEGGSGFPKIVKPDDQRLEARDETPETENQTIESKDQLMPHFVLNELPYVGLSGLLLAGLFAAVMSTIDSGINSLSAVLVYDWLGGRHISVTLSRLLCFLFGISVIGAALLTLLLREYPVIDIIMRIAGSFLGLLMGVYLLGMLVPRANTGGALVGLVIGFSSLVFVWTRTDIHAWWYGVYTCLPTFLMGAAVSYLLPRPRSDQLKGLAFGKSAKETS